MGYCVTCNEWCGYSTSYCEDKECAMVRKLIGLYGIKKIGETLQKVYLVNDKSVEQKIQDKQMVLRSTEKKK